jgi:hypothetical protein
MDDGTRRRYNTLVTAAQFGTDNTADFPPIGVSTFADISDLVEDTELKSAGQQAGLGAAEQQFGVKDSIREDLRDLMATISRTAKALEYTINGISGMFLFQRNMSDAEMLAKARAWITQLPTYLTHFEAYGMPSTLVTDLTQLADQFEASFSSTATANADHVAATADMAAKVRQGMIKLRIADGIARNVYANNPGKLAAWLSASHVEKAPKKKTPPTP